MDITAKTTGAACSKRGGKVCPKQFEESFELYLEHTKQRGFRERTIDDRRNTILKALIMLDESGIESISDITPANIYDIFKNGKQKRSFTSSLRDFLRFLYKNKILANDYSGIVPSFRYTRPVPSIYTKAETEQLLSSIDRAKASGKRNYAIILLALRLGLRTGDIVNLKFSNIDFPNKEISFVQEKTQVPQRLVFLPEIEEAITSYITTARPPSSIPNIFLTLRQPISPLIPSVIRADVHNQFVKAGINIGKRKSGAHSLRMTLASELVAEKVPYDAVRKILGHENPVAIKHYVKYDIDSLRSCAIKIPSVTGKLAVYMKKRTGGDCDEIRL